MKKFRNRLTLVFVLLIGISIGVLGMFVSALIERTSIATLSGRLTKEAHMLAETLDWKTNIEDMHRLAQRYGQMLNVRVTFLRADGTVLGDSEGDPRAMESHADRPEVRQALDEASKTDETIRYSTTVEEQLLYIASPVVRSGETVGVVRLAISLETIRASTRRIGFILLVGMIGLILAAGRVSSGLAQGITRPIEEMTRVARGIERGDFSHLSVRIRSQDELGQLGQAIHHMSVSLQQQWDTIRKSEDRLKSVIETMPSGLSLIDAAGRIQLVNPALERLIGLQADDIDKEPYTRLAPMSQLDELIEECFETKASIREELHIFYPEERILEANVAPIAGDDDHRFAGVVVVLHDMTTIRRLEKMRSEFVANVSHEIKTPITAVIGFTETLLDGALEDEETCRHFLQIIHQESARLHRLIRDILDLSKIESRQLPFNIETLDISQLVREVAGTLKKQIEQSRLHLHLHLPEKLEVESDPDRIRQIIVNLLTNAIIYTPENGRIDLTLTRRDKTWQLKVTDTGVGIPEADLPRIFERFYRVDKARSRESGGTGLGLAIVKHLVEGLNGSIDVESAVNKGTAFTVTFPIRQRSEEKI